MPQLFVGAGWSFPLRTDSTGSISLSSGDEEIAEAIRLILSTSMGERPMRPNFGCRIHDRLFESVDGNMIAQMKLDVTEALAMWEPRINVGDVTVREVEDKSLNQFFYVDITYSIKGANDRRNLVFPFYVIPERE
jgi:uncharacterized protein